MTLTPLVFDLDLHFFGRGSWSGVRLGSGSDESDSELDKGLVGTSSAGYWLVQWLCPMVLDVS